MLRVSQGCTRLDRTPFRIRLDCRRRFRYGMQKQVLWTLRSSLPALKTATALLHSFEILKSQQDPACQRHRLYRSEGCIRSMGFSRIMLEFLNGCHDPRRASCANFTCSNLCDLKLQSMRDRKGLTSTPSTCQDPTQHLPLCCTHQAARVPPCSSCALDTIVSHVTEKVG